MQKVKMKASTAPWSHMHAQGRGGVPPGWGDPKPEEHLFRLVEGSGSGDMREAEAGSAVVLQAQLGIRASGTGQGLRPHVWFQFPPRGTPLLLPRMTWGDSLHPPPAFRGLGAE